MIYQKEDPVSSDPQLGFLQCVFEYHINSYFDMQMCNLVINSTVLIYLADTFEEYKLVTSLASGTMSAHDTYICVSHVESILHN